MQKLIISVATIAGLCAATLIAGAIPVNARPTYIDSDTSAAAVGGYDVVSYFVGDENPVKGDAKFLVRHDGADYYFSSAKNAAAFRQNPARFAPQYGGHCAWAMARGSLAPGDPMLFKVVDGKLFLNFNKQVQATWLGNIAGFIGKADAAWPKIPDDAKFGG